jgi:hypothetical protein
MTQTTQKSYSCGLARSATEETIMTMTRALTVGLTAGASLALLFHACAWRIPNIALGGAFSLTMWFAPGHLRSSQVVVSGTKSRQANWTIQCEPTCR